MDSVVPSSQTSPTINYIIPTYPGKYPKRLTDPKSGEFLNRQLILLNELLEHKKKENIPCLINNVTIIKVKCKPIHQEYENYYDIELWKTLVNICDKIKIIDYEGRNEHFSYDQWLIALLQSTDDYNILIEDDYYIDTDNLHFDLELIQKYKDKFPDNKGYLCSYVGLNPVIHAAISNGIVSKESVQLLGENVLNEFYSKSIFREHINYNIMVYPQIVFSVLFTQKEMMIKDTCNEYVTYFWDSPKMKIIDFTESVVCTEQTFVPIQMYYRHQSK